jgi:Rha family phage regulatory protein
MTALAIQISPTMRTTSMEVAKVFGKTHATVIRAIAAIRIDLPGDVNIYADISYVDSMNRPQTGIEMTRDGFSLLAMGFMGRDALQWKLKFLAAFNAMEATILKNNDKLEWKAARLQIKAVRATFVTSVKDFVDYATAQGSTSAHRYYGNLTKMEYSALGLLDQQKSALGNFRETLDIIDLGYLGVAEITAKAALEYGMQQKMHYKEIYQYAKQKVTEYANAVSIPRLAS